MRIPATLLLTCVITLTTSELTRAESRVALVIGNGIYRTSPLSDPPNDAQLIARTLKRLNFNVIVKTDANEKEMKRLIKNFGNRLKRYRNTVGLFYYSGHAMQIGGRNYMIPVNAEIMDEADVSIEGVGINNVLTRMMVANNATNFVILDACRDNPFEKQFKSNTKGLGRMDAPQGTIIAFAAQPRKVALQGPGRYSYFTESFAKEIVKPGISIRDVLLNVRVAVHRETNGRQTPVVEDQLLTKFYFNQVPVIEHQSSSRIPENDKVYIQVPSSREVEQQYRKYGQHPKMPIDYQPNYEHPLYK